MPINKSWGSLIKRVNSTYCRGKNDGAPAPFKCKKARQVFYAIMRKNKWDETKPRPGNAIDDMELVKKAKDLIKRIDINLYEANMGRLTYKRRKDLPKTAFCDPENRKYPANDAAHVRNGLARIAQNKNDPKYESIRACLVKRAKKFGIRVSDQSREYDDKDFALVRENGEKYFQYSRDGMLDPEMMLDCLQTIDYVEELTDEEWETTKAKLLMIADEYVKAVLK